MVAGTPHVSVELGPCIENTLYCGGAKLEGDPRTLYRCTSGAGTVVMTCTIGCAVNPGLADACR